MAIIKWEKSKIEKDKEENIKMENKWYYYVYVFPWNGHIKSNQYRTGWKWSLITTLATSVFLWGDLETKKYIRNDFLC